MQVPAGADDRPNVIFILTDDQGCGDGAAFGHPYLKTPTLDRLAAEGSHFKQFYVASPVCSPSRAAFMTGQYPARHSVDHIYRNDTEWNDRLGIPHYLDPSVETLPGMLRRAGYVTGHFGKWHLGKAGGAPDPGAYGIDEHLTYASPGDPMFACADEMEPVPEQLWRECGRSEEQARFYRYSSQIIADQAINFIEKHRDERFFMNVWTAVPHAPLLPTETMLAEYRRLAPSADARQFGRWMQDYLRKAPDLERQMKTYCAAMTDLDVHIGRVIERLDALGLADNTIVVFASDNGPEDYEIGNARNAGVGNTGPLRARKRSLYEGGIRTPLLVRWPGRVPAGRVDDENIVAAVDLLPTVCELAGVEVPADIACDGTSVASAWQGAKRERSKPLHWEWMFKIWHDDYVSPMLAIREGDWKLLHNPDGSRVELYDVNQDPEEVTNRAADYPDVVNRLREASLAWQRTLPESRVRNQWTEHVAPWDVPPEDPLDRD